MANKSVNILLTLRDKFTPKLRGTTKEIRKQKAELNAGTKVLKRWGDNANQAFKHAAIGAATAASALVGLAAKVGLTEAMDLEGYKAQLETATKSTSKASNLMQYAIKMANKTPFEGGELVEGAAKFESMGMSAKKWLTLAGDMAGATNKSFDQATEALIDAQTGELERLKEFGITKAMVLQKGEELFSGVQIANNKGQITNQEKFNEALEALMHDKFAGGMEKQAQTLRGVMSTVSGIAKNTLANIVGMQNDGSIKAGSALDYIKSKAQSLADKLQNLQATGNLDKMIQNVGSAVKVAGTILSGFGSALSFIIQNLNIIGPILAGVVAGFVAFNVISGVIKAMKAFSTITKAAAVAQGLLNAAMIANPIGLIVTAIGLVVAAIALLIVNFDKVKAAGLKAFGAIKNFVLTLGAAFAQIGREIKSAFIGAFNAVKSKVSSVVSWIRNKINGIKSALHGIGSAIGGALGIGGHATGTSYFKGGLTRINEGGRGEIVDLPNGTRIIPHDVSEKMAREDAGGSVIININVQGNMIGNRRYMEETGEYIAKKILMAQGGI